MRAAELVLRWCDVYTRGLSPAVAGERRDELASDLWEHAADAPRSGAAMLSRAIRGVPADLAWRYEQKRAARQLVPMGARVVGGGVATLSAAAASALIGAGILALMRHSAFNSLFWTEATSSIVGFTILAVIGAGLLVRTRTRSLGAVALAASTSLIHFVRDEFTRHSVTANELGLVREWELAEWCLIACFACVFLSAAVLWLPRREAAL